MDRVGEIRRAGVAFAKNVWGNRGPEDHVGTYGERHLKST
jgi:hypothetical protein